MQNDTTGKLKNRSLFGYFILWVKGFCMGAADVVPGVSGGTMAFILGIYDELISSIRSFDLKGLRLLMGLKMRQLLEHISWEFLLALGLGILTAIFSLARVLSWLLDNRPVLVWSFFVGLILASAISISRRIEKWRSGTWICLFAGIMGTYVIVGLVPVSTPDKTWFLFLCGAVAICAMILPGISGSFILVLLGKYKYVLDAVNNKDIFVIGIFAAGACMGIIVFSRILGWLLKKHHDFMVAILTGLMLGSLRKVWPFKKTIESITDIHGKIIPLVQSNIIPAEWNMEVSYAIVLAVVGLVVVYLLDSIGEEKHK
ncbi:MAG TPA: DUF368 domain-containing protein [Desulfobacteraceae bacterium]|nr:DUF368 domain-containing protein [Desulfobacteraceae bacterium]HPJ67630.1 DUF368 domain-containing protein [Desulfobacteraceae bacterium]HPQ29947.1 DUF368 domain-containing protein [Desulfobacteraceae bacterium]